MNIVVLIRQGIIYVPIYDFSGRNYNGFIVYEITKFRLNVIILILRDLLDFILSMYFTYIV